MTLNRRHQVILRMSLPALNERILPSLLKWRLTVPKSAPSYFPVIAESMVDQLRPLKEP